MEYIHKAKARSHVRRCSTTRWRPVVPRTRYCAFLSLVIERLIHSPLLGCSRTSCPENCREETSVPGGGRYTCERVNIPYTTHFHMFLLLLYAMHRMPPSTSTFVHFIASPIPAISIRSYDSKPAKIRVAKPSGRGPKPSRRFIIGSPLSPHLGLSLRWVSSRVDLS